MRSSVLAAICAVAAVSSAQTVPEIVAQFPPCALPCVAKAVMKAGCGLTDIQCQCSKEEEVQAVAAPCLIESATCSPDELSDFLDLATQACELALAGPSPSSSSITSVVAAPSTSSASASSSVSVIQSNSTEATVTVESTAISSTMGPTPTVPTSIGLLVQATGAAVNVKGAKAAALAGGLAAVWWAL